MNLARTVSSVSNVFFANNKKKINNNNNLQTKHKAADKILEQCFLKEIKATCKNSGESEQKQKNAI